MAHAYRSDQQALEERRAHLRAQLSALEAAEAERRAAAAELASIDRRLHELHRRALPMLDRVNVAAPCHVSWDSMKGDERVRFCGDCSQNVFNLSSMSRDEATEFVKKAQGLGERVCVRFYRRADGTMLTSDCPVGVRRRRRRRIIGGAVMALSALGLGTAAFAHYSQVRTTTMGEMPVHAVQGDVAFEPPAQAK